MAEDDVDEDESFGDFHFVSSFPSTLHHSQINAPISSDSLVGSQKSGWTKPRGAIPLSIFGEEEIEGSGVDESRVGDGATVFAQEKKKKPDLGVNDLIVNLYNRNRESESKNGSQLDFNGSGLNVNGSDSNGNKGFIDDDGGDDDDDDDDDGWEFKAAEMESGIGNGDSKLKEEGVLESPGLKVEAKVREDKEIQVDGKGWENTEGARNTFGYGNGVHGPSDLFAASNGISNGSGQWDFGFDFNMSSMAKQDVFTSGLFPTSKDNDTANVVNSSAADNKVSFVENFWDFKDPFPEIGSKHKLEEPKVADTSPARVEALTFGSNGVGGPIDLFTVSNGLSQKSGKWDSGFNFSPSSVNGVISDPYSKSKQNDLVSSLVDENDGADENFWEFKDAFSESGSKHKSEEPKVAHISPASVAVIYDANGASNPKDSLVASNGVSHKSGEWEFEFNFNPTYVTQDDIISGSNSESKQNNLSSLPVDENDEYDENFGEFKDAFSETGSKHEEESKVADYTTAVVEAPAFGGEIQRNEVRSENHREPLPMSIFSDGKLESDDSSILQDSTFTLTSNPRSSIQSPGSNTSINDLISSLYSQAKQNASVNNTPKASDHEVHSTPTVFESDLVNGDDDFDDDSWDFKAAVSGTRAEDQTSDIDLGDSQKKLSTTLELNDCVDFYCKLKDELCLIALCHLDNLKKAQSTAALSGEEAKAKALDEEIQKFYDELHEDDLISKEEVPSEHLSPRNIHFNEFLEVLQEPKFQVLESEYELSRRLSLAEKDIRSAIELLKDVALTLTILKLGSVEEQHYYISTWSKIVSVCAQELKHGALIWNELSQKNVQSQILSEPQGKRYILALGEIYRVVEVLRASTKLYKPWIILTSMDTTGLVGLLSECYSTWASSGLEDALKSISDRIDFEYDGTIKELLESIKYIHDIDALALQNHFFSGQQPMCRLSALSAGILPGLRLVVWNGEHYFLTLANLWANLISIDPPI